MERKVCEQCGRVGTRGFTILGPTVIDWLDPPCTLPAIVVCASIDACRKRRPRISEDDLERTYV